MYQLSVDGLRIGYERSGDGPLLLLLHGYVGDGRTTWRRQIEALSAIHGRGVERTRRRRLVGPAGSLGMSGYADLAAEFVAQLGLGRPHVAGHRLPAAGVPPGQSMSRLRKRVVAR
jgi:pimeloyl-ACP methyl ester carboxylesterase